MAERHGNAKFSYYQLTIEHAVGNQTARVDDSIVARVDRLAIAVVDGAVRDGVSTQLVRVERLDISTVILVIVCDCVKESQLSGPAKFGSGQAAGGTHVCST